MRIADSIHLAGVPDADTDRAVRAAIGETQWPLKSGGFALRPLREKHENGVGPIKKAFYAAITGLGWEAEHRVEGIADFPPGPIDFFHGSRVALEWETGNVASVQRSGNKLFQALVRQVARGAVLIVPATELKPYLTDRVANLRELESYLRNWTQVPAGTFFWVVVVSYDDIVEGTPVIPKGTDGRSAQRLAYFELEVAVGSEVRHYGAAAVDREAAASAVCSEIRREGVASAPEVRSTKGTALFAWRPLVRRLAY